MSANDVFNLTGMIVADKYALGDPVGESSYSVVYRATHLGSRQPFALQVFKVLGEYGERARERLLAAFVDQANNLRQLGAGASAIRAPRDIGPLALLGGKWVPFMAFDWLEGSPLDAILAARRGSSGAGLYDLGSAMSLLDPVVAALDLLHANGLAHLDLKPGNVFVTVPPPHSHVAPVHLLDCSTAYLVSRAQLEDEGSGAGLSIGPTYFEPAYAASEQFLSPGPPTGPWTDVFSLALVLTEMITGRPMARNADMVSLASAPRPTPRMLGAKVGDEVEAVFSRALSIDPAKRHRTAGEFWSATRAALAQSALPRPPRSPSGPRPPRSDRVRDKIVTSPDLVREKLEAEELSQRSPRLVIVTVTLLLVGIAMGLLCTHIGATPGQTSPSTAPVQGHR